MSERMILELRPEHRGVNSNTFTGRPQGEEVRRVLNLDGLDKENTLFDVTIPESTTSFNPSFFLGLFFDSIKRLKGYDNFEKKYRIVINEENPLLKEGLEGDFEECKRQAINEFNQKTGISL